MELKTIRTFDNSIQANLVKLKLENEGVISFLFDEYSVSLNPLYSNTLGGIKLKVSEKEYEQASKIIEEMESQLVTNKDGDVLLCPNCGSNELYTDFKSMNSLGGLFASIISFVFMVFPFFYKTVYRCKKCETEFKNES